MKGRFTYKLNENAEGIFMVIWIFTMIVLPAVLWTYGHLFSGLLLFFGSIIALYSTLFLRGYYTADNEGVTLRVPLRRYRFSYSDIKSVNTKHRDGGHSRIDDTITIVTELTIYTDNGSYRVNSSKDFSMNEQLKDAKKFEKDLNELELVQLGNYIRTKIN